MGMLDKFCRFCTSELDVSQRRNIFETGNSQLLKTALKCIPLPMSSEDQYPNFTCLLCASKLNDFAEFQSNGLSAVGFFDDYLTRNNVPTVEPVPNSVEASIKIEVFEEPEIDLGEEFLPKLEPRTENPNEDAECGPDECNSTTPARPWLDAGIKIEPFDETESDPENKFSPKLETRSHHEEVGCVDEENEIIPGAQGVEQKPSSESQSIAVTTTRENPFKCKHCTKSFRYNSALVTHIRVHTGEKPFQCTQCKKSFGQKATLDSHVRTHTGEKPFQCKHCNRSFNQASHLNSHVKWHTGEKPVQCEYCKKKFVRKPDLLRHVRIHTGEKPFQCEYCKKAFTFKANLVTHIRIHTGEKPYKCTHCKTSFSQASSLVTHVRLHTAEKPYGCGQCEKSFTQRSSLVAHLRAHKRRNPFTSE